MTLAKKIDQTDKCAYNFSCLWSSEPARCDSCTILCSEGENALVLSGKAPPSCHYRMRWGDREMCRCPVRFELYQRQCGMGDTRAGLLITNATDIIINTNTWMEQLSGLPRDRIIGASIRTALPAGLIDNIILLYDRARVMLTSQRFDAVPATAPGGVRIALSGWLIPATVNGKLDRMICTLEDTARQQAQAGSR